MRTVDLGPWLGARLLLLFEELVHGIEARRVEPVVATFPGRGTDGGEEVEQTLTPDDGDAGGLAEGIIVEGIGLEGHLFLFGQVVPMEQLVVPVPVVHEDDLGPITERELEVADAVRVGMADQDGQLLRIQHPPECGNLAAMFDTVHVATTTGTALAQTGKTGQEEQLVGGEAADDDSVGTAVRVASELGAADV